MIAKKKYLIRNKKVYNIDYKLKQILDKEEDIKFYQKPSYYMNRNQIAFSTNEIGSEPEFYIRDTGLVLILFNFIFLIKNNLSFRHLKAN